MTKKKYSETLDIPWGYQDEMNDLVTSLVAHFDLKVGVWHSEEGKYLDAEDLSSVEYISPEESILPDETTLKVHNLGEHYDDVTPDVHPMGFVVEFNKPGHSPRYLEVYGHYVSHDGGYYDGWREVTPKVVTVNTFESL